MALDQEFSTIFKADSSEYVCQTPLNLYDSPACERLATQAAAGRHLQILALPASPAGVSTSAVKVCLCEDDYPGWLSSQDLTFLVAANVSYAPIALSRAEITTRLPDVIAFAQAAMNQPNQYLWGGTIGPDYDCSGLMQTAFAAAGIRLPRDAYQQEAFTERIRIEDLQPGDLVFFGTAEKANHVGLYLGEEQYLHSSGKDQGRNGIGIDVLSDRGDRISQTYYRQFRTAGRVIQTYLPKNFNL